MAVTNPAIDALLHSLEPSNSVLLDWPKPMLNDAMLRKIADSDYEYKSDEHYRALLAIRDHQQIPSPLGWVPLEVLQLTKWLEPDNQTETPGTTRTNGHIMRAFCCAVLIRAADDPATMNSIFSENDTLAQLLASAIHLGRNTTQKTRQLLVWRLLRMEHADDFRPFLIFAILLLSVHRRDLAANDLVLLVDWVLQEEAQVRIDDMTLIESDEWLLGLTNFNQRHEVWRELTRTILLGSDNNLPDSAQYAVRTIADSMNACR